MGSQLNAAEQWDKLRPYAASELRAVADAAVARALAGGSRTTVVSGGGGGGTTVHTLASPSGVGSLHTISATAAGHVLRASSTTAAAMAQLQHSDLGSLTTGDPHTQYALRARSITGTGALGGGGDLSADRTISLNTPGTLTYATTNSSGTNHTHAVTATHDYSAGGSGLLMASSGDVSLDQITANSVTTPSLLSATTLTVTPGTYAILSDGKSLRTTTYTSGFAGSGFRLDQGVATAGQTTLVVDNLTVRGLMEIYELLIHKVRATNGSIIVSNTGKITVRSLYSGSEGAVGSVYTLYTDAETAHGFAVDDLIRAQKFTGTGSYQSSLKVVSVGSAEQFRAELISGYAPQVGYEYVRLGNVSDADRRGGVYLTADDSGAPFLDVWDGVTSFTGSTGWQAAGTLKARLGKLDGITGGTNEYGLWAGSATLGNLLATGGKVALRQGTTEVITLAADGTSYFAGVMTIGASGGIYQGSGTFGTPTTGLKIWRDGSIGRIAGYAGGTLQWGATTGGTLTAGGGNVILDASGLTVQTSPSDENSYFQFGLNSYGGAKSRFRNEYYVGAGTYPQGHVWEMLDYYGNVGASIELYSIVALGDTGQANELKLTADDIYITGDTVQTGTLSTGALTAASVTSGGAASFGAGVSTGSAALTLGGGRTDSGYAYIDLLGDTTYTTYGTRLQRGNAGANATTTLAHRGTGDMLIYLQEAAALKAYTNATLRMTIDSGGLVGIGVAPATQKLKVLGSIAAGGDDGGTAGYTTLTNATVAASTGTVTIKSRNSSNVSSTGFIKIYDGTSVKYIPYVD